MNTMKTKSDWHNISFYERMCVCACVCFWACLLTYVRHWYLWESVLWFRPDLWRQMHLPGGSKGMCVCVEEVGCNCGNCKQSLVLSSSFFSPLSRLTSRICLCACACVCLCLSPPVSNVQISPFNSSAYAYQLRWHLDRVQMIGFFGVITTDAYPRAYVFQLLKNKKGPSPGKWFVFKLCNLKCVYNRGWLHFLNLLMSVSCILLSGINSSRADVLHINKKKKKEKLSSQKCQQQIKNNW